MTTRMSFIPMHSMGWCGPDMYSEILGNTRWIVRRVDAPADEALIREYCY